MGSPVHDQGSEKDNNDANSQSKEEAEAGDEPMAYSLHNDDDVAELELDVGPQQGPAVGDDHCSPEESQSAAAGSHAGTGSEIRNADPAQVASSESEDFEGQADNFRRPDIAEWVQNVLLDRGAPIMTRLKKTIKVRLLLAKQQLLLLLLLNHKRLLKLKLLPELVGREYTPRQRFCSA
jgi:hypothetical protein